jgi:hypothetical protein
MNRFVTREDFIGKTVTNCVSISKNRDKLVDTIKACMTDKNWRDYETDCYIHKEKTQATMTPYYQYRKDKNGNWIDPPDHSGIWLLFTSH